MNFNSFTKKINWPQAVAEITLIILGILVALLINNWWEERLERQAEISYLEALNIDFRNNIATLENRIKNQRKIMDAGNDVLNLIKSGLNKEITKEFISILYTKLYWFNKWVPAIGTYDNLINSGHLLYIQNSQLRKEMTQFHKSLEYVEEREEQLYKTYYSRQAPFLAKYIGDSKIIETIWRGPKLPISPFSTDIEAFATREYWNLVIEWMFVHSDVVLSYEDKLADSNRILDLIQIELAKKHK